jgi:hypothetical protein
MAYNQEVFSRQYPVIFFFVQHLAYNRGLKAAWNGTVDPSPFWASTTDGHLKLATIAWCNVFGSRNSNMHWTKTTVGETSKEEQEGFRQRMLSKTSFSEQQWEDYQKAMRAFRDKFVAHVDLDVPFRDPIPSFNPALQVAYVYHEWIRELIRPVFLNQPTLSSKYEQWKAESSSVITTFFSNLK